MNERKNLAPEFAALCERLEGAGGKKYWRSLEELADSSAFRALMEREFPQQALDGPGQLSRRQFLTLMGASLALAGLGGCSVRPAPSGTLVPYVKAPEEVVPGKPLFYATSMTLGGCGVGLLVESHLGRPTKIEGNPEHPASLGGTDPYHQASVLGLYDPDRSKTVTSLGRTATWEAGLRALGGEVEKQRGRKGAGLRLLTETVVSPTLAGQIERLLKELPEARWHQYEPLARDAAHRASVQAFGVATATRYDFTKADVVLSLDADFFAHAPGSLRYVADFMARRQVRTTAGGAGEARMNRLYVVETAVSITGAKADHRLALPAGQIEGVARAIASALGVAGAGGDRRTPHAAWVRAVAADLQQHRGRCVVVAGDRQPAAVHLLAHAMNERLGNRGATVLHTDPVEARPSDQARSLRELADDMSRRRVEALVILGGNPVFTAPADLQFRERMQRVPFRAHLGLYQDETSRQCQWHFPEAHYLESWGDTRAFDGTASLAQPIIEPLYRGRSAVELLSSISGERRTGLEVVKDHWRRRHASQKSTGDFEDFWQTSLHDGVIAGTQFAARTVPFAAGWEKHLAPPATPFFSRIEGRYELVFQPDPTIYDGRFANNGWLQELPKPITRLTWDNAALMSPATAKELGVALGGYAHGGEHGGFHQPVVELTIGGRTVSAPAWIVPGHADGSITVSLGYGRTAAGRVGGSDGSVGFDAYALRTSDRPWFAPGAEAVKIRRTYLLACTQEHQLMENRDLVRSAALAEYRRTPDFATRDEEAEVRKDVERIGGDPKRGRVALRLYDGAALQKAEHRWGMSIDLTTCIGCNTCVVACQSENNIPVVGKEQVAAGREMHWLRVDRYNSGPADAPTEFHFQPVPCMHCEDAPCEYVCPVEATVHSADGLNDMVYQRCVGTRFCSNNCPYKVRRFNFFHYADYVTEGVRQQYNPDVTVRSRGVMEKCSYCVQRIRQGDIDAQREGRPLADGEILTACQSACPAKAISFGDLEDGRSEVSRWKESPLSYALLADLNTKPRTTYLAALRNPNPALEGE